MASGVGARPKQLHQRPVNGLAVANSFDRQSPNRSDNETSLSTEVRTGSDGLISPSGTTLTSSGKDKIVCTANITPISSGKIVSPAKVLSLEPTTSPAAESVSVISSLSSPVMAAKNHAAICVTDTEVNTITSSSAKGKGGKKEQEAREVEQAAEGVLVERLKDVQYEPTTCKRLSQELAAQVMERLKSTNLRGHKLVAVVSVGSLKERPGMQFGTRCLWNDETDKFASVKFTNGSLFAVAMVYALRF